MTQPICPNCGIDLAQDEPIDRGAIAMQPYGECRWHDESIHMPPAERALVWSLLKADGRPLPFHILAERLGYEGDHNIVAVHLSRLRKRFDAVAPNPFVTVRGMGVRLAA